MNERELPPHVLAAMKRGGHVLEPASAPSSPRKASPAVPAAAAPKTGGRARQAEDGGMNKWEAAYAAELELLRFAGKLKAWKFQGISLQLAKRTWYRPDFLVELPGLARPEIHEVKGHWEDDARAKVKIAAALYPLFVFRCVRPRDRSGLEGWQRETLPPHERE